MKKICLVLALSLLLTGCGKKETPAVSAPAASASVEEEKPLVLEELAVEFLRHSADAAVLMQAVKELPQQLREALAEEGVEVERVSVTMSGSCASTVQAVEEGGVDLAFLPVEELVRAEGYPQVALLPGSREWTFTPRTRTTAKISPAVSPPPGRSWTTPAGALRRGKTPSSCGLRTIMRETAFRTLRT